MRQAGLPLRVKKLFDRTVAAAALVATAPVMAATAVAVAASMGRPVLFRQRRPGLHGQPFEIAKFRTMRDARDAHGALLPDGERLTAVGKFLRSTSLDELPQLWNVLRGELSLVGPRPLLMQYLPRYSAEQARRHDVLPGITGWAQIHGRNEVDWDTRFELDVWYVDHWSLLLDLKILAATVRTLVRREGINRRDHATMYEFMGSATRAN
ncbi:MAG TPA: sugar transferase [Kofleriaceae bacterium]|nr:sugar transferase [Kofleriaceae bacterium]